MKLRRPSIQFVVWLGVVAAAGAAISHFSGMPYWAGALLVGGALLFNSIVAEVEDREPETEIGTQSKPNSKARDPR
jgi:hypothetical protein